MNIVFPFPSKKQPNPNEIAWTGRKSSRLGGLGKVKERNDNYTVQDLERSVPMIDLFARIITMRILYKTNKDNNNCN